MPKNSINKKEIKGDRERVREVLNETNYFLLLKHSLRWLRCDNAKMIDTNWHKGYARRETFLSQTNLILSATNTEDKMLIQVLTCTIN